MEAARRAGASRGSLHRWENGENAPGTPALLRLLEGLQAESRDRAHLLAVAPPQRAQVAIVENPLGSLALPGELLRALREARGDTQAELAAHLGVGQPTVAKWETGFAMPAGETLARALAHLDAAKAGLREDSLDLYEPVTDPLDGRIRLREEIERYPFSLQMAFMLALERELWRLAVRDSRWEASLVEVLAWRSEGHFARGDYTAALEVARQSLHLAENVGEWDAAQRAFEVVGRIRVFRRMDGASQVRKTAESLSRFRNPFVRAEMMCWISEVAGRFDFTPSREFWARAMDTVRENEPDELFGGHTFATAGRGMGAFDLDRRDSILRSSGTTETRRPESTSAPSRIAGKKPFVPKKCRRPSSGSSV